MLSIHPSSGDSSLNRVGWRRSLSLAGGALLALLVAESFVRLTAFQKAAYDRRFGWVVKPETTARYWGEGRGVSSWVSHGVRGPHPVRFGPEPRVLVLGDSFTEALNVNDAETFVAVAQARIPSRIGGPVLINAGKSSRSPADYVAQADTYLRLFRPVWTVVQLTDQDFLGDSWREGRTRFTRSGTDRRLNVVPVVDRAPSGRLAGTVYHEVSQRVALVPFLHSRLSAFAAGARNEPPLFEAGRDRSIDSPEKTAALEPIAEELDLLARAFNERVSLLYVSWFEPRTPKLATPIEMAVLEAAGARGLRVIQMREAWPKFADAGRAPFGFTNSAFNKGHLNLAGHRAVGEALATEIEALRSSGLF